MVIFFPIHDGQVISPSLLSSPDLSDSSKMFLSWSLSQELKRAWWSIYFDKSVSRAIKEIVSTEDFLLSKDLTLYYRFQYIGFQNKLFSAVFFSLNLTEQFPMEIKNFKDEYKNEDRRMILFWFACQTSVGKTILSSSHNLS